MITVPNQKVIRIEKEPCGKGNLYAAINLNAMEAAAQALDAGAFKLWIYFAKNQNGYEFALSSKDAHATFGLGKSQYDTAVKKLISSGYLTNTQGNQYIFSEIPASKQLLYENYTTPLSDNNTRNNTNNTGATAGDNDSLAGILYLPSATAEVGAFDPGGSNVPGETRREEIKRIEPGWLYKQMNHCMPIRHVRDDIIQLSSGKMYRVVDWDGALYETVMQYANQCNDYIERNRDKPKLQALSCFEILTPMCAINNHSFFRSIGYGELGKRIVQRYPTISALLVLHHY